VLSNHKSPDFEQAWCAFLECRPKFAGSNNLTQIAYLMVPVLVICLPNKTAALSMNFNHEKLCNSNCTPLQPPQNLLTSPTGETTRSPAEMILCLGVNFRLPFVDRQLKILVIHPGRIFHEAHK
jgi:hypothetical protein